MDHENDVDYVCRICYGSNYEERAADLFLDGLVLKRDVHFYCFDCEWTFYEPVPVTRGDDVPFVEPES